MIYQTPQQYYFRLHHVRPRFKSNVEDVLFFVANELAKIPKLPKDEFKEYANNAIRLFPNNAISTQKTIDNWRTEIAALFGFIQKDSTNKTAWAGAMASKLAEEQDLVQFFKYFLFYFQYPGGHLKTHKVKELIENGVKFKPAQYILRLLETGEKMTGKRFGISKAELTHVVFNDLRVTRDNIAPNQIVNTILENRQQKLEYIWDGDIIRYAGDIIDYMILANLLVNHNSSLYYINWSEKETITAFTESKIYFDKYDIFYNQNVNLILLKQLEDDWFNYVNQRLDDTLFKTDILQFLGLDKATYQLLIDTSIEGIQNTLDTLDSTKAIGDLGENLIIGHECTRLKLGNRQDLIHLVKKIPNIFAIGYDIKSFELNGIQRLIEVKTTISSNTLHFYNFHLTTNEWNAAESYNDRYFVYRLMISKYDKKLFIIQNPVAQYKQNNLKMSPRNGADIVFDNKAGTWENLLLWKS